jgi:hypothetical protein
MEFKRVFNTILYANEFSKSSNFPTDHCICCLFRKNFEKFEKNYHYFLKFNCNLLKLHLLNLLWFGHFYYFWDIKEDQNYSPAMVAFPCSKCFRFFFDNLEIEHWKFNTLLKYSYIHSLYSYYRAIIDVLNQKTMVRKYKLCSRIFFEIFRNFLKNFEKQIWFFLKNGQRLIASVFFPSNLL